jgi:hypothetical protein
VAIPMPDDVRETRRRRECPIIKVVREMHDACDSPIVGCVMVDHDFRALMIGIRMHTRSREISEEGDTFVTAYREFRRGLNGKVLAALDAYVTAVSKE